MLNDVPAGGHTKPAASRKFFKRGVYTMENRNQNNQNNNQNNSNNQNNNQNNSQNRNQK